MRFTPEDVRANSPKSLSLVELRTQRDLDIFRTIYHHSIRIGDEHADWEITYGTEFHMTGDSKQFPPRVQWEAKGYTPDVFGRWIGPGQEVAIPLFEGSMIHQHDPIYQGWLSGLGTGSLWTFFGSDQKMFSPRFLIAEQTLTQKRFDPGFKIAFRDVARNTHTRTFLATCLPAMPCGHTISTLRFGGDTQSTLAAAASLNSFCFDYILRIRNSGLHQSWFMISDCPLPKTLPASANCNALTPRVTRLTFLHRRFAPEWLLMRHFHPALANREWKQWWAVTEADRLRLRVEIDALVADHYGLTPDDFDWIVRDDSTDPKGFYRVDRNLPFRERLTGVAAVAFRALKSGQWDAARANAMSNDEFFAAIGIPEMTAGPNPLIRKRDGCHRWHPEEFGPDDPRHGWTWDHCRQDAIALLGSEEAVRKYVKGVQAEKEPEKASVGSTDLLGQPLPPTQRKLF